MSIRSFWFTIAYHNLHDFDDVRALQEARRAIAQRHAQFQLAGWHEYDMHGDAREAITAQLLQTTGVHTQAHIAHTCRWSHRLCLTSTIWVGHKWVFRGAVVRQ
jgi:hypothetical protein